MVEGLKKEEERWVSLEVVGLMVEEREREVGEEEEEGDGDESEAYWLLSFEEVEAVAEEIAAMEE